jgi:hypothetical protein
MDEACLHNVERCNLAQVIIMPVVTTVKWRTAGLTGLVGRRWETRNAEASEFWCGDVSWKSGKEIKAMVLNFSGVADPLPSHQSFWH